MSTSSTLTMTPGARAGLFNLSCGSVVYLVEFRPSTDVVLGDLLRRLQPVLAGGDDPSGKLDPLTLLREVGVRLWRALLPEPASDEQRATLVQMLVKGTTPLLLTLPSALAGLPWELLCNPDSSGDLGFVARRRPLARLLPGDNELPPIEPPLRVLLLISSPPGIAEARQVDVESERAAVEQAVRKLREDGLLHLSVEDIVTTRRVQQALLRFRPHIVHYIGHGGYADDLGGFLEWEDDRGMPLLHPDARIADLFRPRGLRAVLLHGCNTATSDTQIDFTGVAGALLGVGIPAVLAQQGKFTYESSQRVSDAFYNALATGLGLAEATFEARLALQQAERPDWAVPLLQAASGGLGPLLDAQAAPAEADPALTQQTPVAGLPAPTGVFVGRQRELRALRQMLESAPGSGPVMALIAGPGGVGKSTLAAQAIVRYGGRYRAGLLLSCRAYTGIDLFLKEIGEFLLRQGAPEFLSDTLPDPKLSQGGKIAAAVDALNRSGPFLLVVDNLESVQGDDRQIADVGLLRLLQTLLFNLRGGRALVTGRYAVAGLVPDEKFQSNLLSLDLDDLSGYEVRQLVARHPALAHLGGAVVDELVKEFGGLPYVYDLLSSQGASQDLAGILFDIQQRKTRIKQEHSAEEWARVRRRVVEFAALDATVARLPQSARELLAQLSVFQRPFPLEAIEQGLGAARADWQSLIQWALLRYDTQDRDYQLHSLTVDYASQLLDSATRVATQQRAAEWYLAWLKESRDLGDALAAHTLFSVAGAAERAGELANRLAEPLSRFGLYSIWRDLGNSTMRNCTGSLAAEAQRQLGMIAQAQGQYDEARRLYGESLQIAERLGDQGGRATTLHQLGNIAQAQGQYDEARRLYGEVLSAFERLGDQGGRATTLGQLGLLARQQHDNTTALHFMFEALDIFERLYSPYRELARRTIAELRSEMGEAAFSAAWQKLTGGLPPDDQPSIDPSSALLQKLIAFIQAGTWNEAGQPDEEN